MKYKIKAVLCANAGVSITTPNSRIWVDALHDQHEETFSDVTPEIWEAMKKHPDFRNPDVLVFTHLHGDHFSRRLLEEAMRIYPSARVILPATRSMNTSASEAGKMSPAPGKLSAEELFRQFEIGEDSICCIRTLHEGRAFTDTVHEAVVLESCGKRILLTGDMRIDESVAEGLVREYAGNTGAFEEDFLFDAVFAAFPWETTTKGRKIMNSILRPRKLVLYHIPFEEDDLFGYREGVRKRLAAAEAEKTRRVEALMEKFSETVF